jgi:hypothetical protein
VTTRIGPNAEPKRVDSYCGRLSDMLAVVKLKLTFRIAM